jgi:hypothetical protein
MKTNMRKDLRSIVHVSRARARARFALVAFLVSSVQCFAGSITATLKTEEPIKRVWAVERQFRDDGSYSVPHEGKIAGDKLTIADLPDEGLFDLRFETEAGTVEGYDRSVPKSSDDPQTPLTLEDRNQVFDRLAKFYARNYPDEVTCLDIMGNSEHAMILLSTIRRRDSVSESFRPGEMVYRSEHYHYENPEGDSWVQYQEQPYYTLDRRRLFQPEMDRLTIVYAAHLGGIRLKKGHADADLGTIKVPVPKLGVHAVNADGKPLQEVKIRPKPDAWPAPVAP